MTVRAGATAAGNDVRLSGRSICSLAGVAAAWVSVTFERQHVGRVNCLTPRDAAEAEIAQRMHSCRASFALFERAASVDMRAQAHAFDAGPGTDSIVKARTSQPSSLRIQERMRSTPEGSTPGTAENPTAITGFQAKELQFRLSAGGSRFRTPAFAADFNKNRLPGGSAGR